MSVRLDREVRHNETTESEMEKCERLELVSDKIRQGIPVSMSEAIEAIDYQAALREYRKQNTLWARFRKWLSA